MKFILQLSKLSLCLIFFSSNTYPMQALTEELLRKRLAATQESKVVTSLSEERKSDLSITSETTTIEDRGSLSSVGEATSKEDDLLPAVTKQISSLRSVFGARDTISSKELGASLTAPFGQGGLRKTTSRLTGANVEGSFLTLPSKEHAKTSTSKRDADIEPLPEHHETFKYVGGQRIVKNPKADEK